MTEALTGPDRPEEGLVEIDGQGFYAVPDVDRMPPFLMSVVSDGDRWMFVSSRGGLTAGRVDSAKALFPYETDDRLHDAAGVSGPVTAIRRNGIDGPWTPFRGRADASLRRNLYKSVVGNSVLFEEINLDLQLEFRYRWTSSDEFGFVRTATLRNKGERPVRLELIDGLFNVLPHGLDPSIYQTRSNLGNAYRRSEIIDEDVRLAVYSLESRVVDRPEPAESLRASAIWSLGIPDAVVTVDPDAVASLESGRNGDPVSLLTGRRGAYLLQGAVDLDPNGDITWHIVGDVALDQVAVAGLRKMLHTKPDLSSSLIASITDATENLVDIMAPSDALQRTGDRVATAHQFANVTYNVLRGGIPLSGYHVGSEDFRKFVASRNLQVADRHRELLESLPEVVDRKSLFQQIRDAGDPHLIRLGYEYLPFSFSRRHGDPSRPWNAFSIRTRDQAGEPIIYYEGNWRDIFQNWEALCMSFPEYLPGVISVFLNASTPDGFNPYRITRDGVDWEVPDPEDPWSNIGYWGDHQIVYLLRLIEAAENFLPGTIEEMLGRRLFTYADVPYRLATYSRLVHDPKDTIEFDEVAEDRSEKLVASIGGDGRLLWGEDGRPQLVTMVEKLVVPVLAKLSNFVPGGGIWMNTQRPEWNDANNALVGYGLSMVTLSYLRKYLDRLKTLLGDADLSEIPMSVEVADWMSAVSSALGDSPPEEAGSGDQARKGFLDVVGEAFSNYRSRIYDTGFTDVTAVELDTIVRLCEVALAHLDDTIHANRRPDGLYHSYNLVNFGDDGSTASIEHLYEMLEGQVAVLESGVLTAAEKLTVIDALFSSAMYRADQKSFMLYPARRLPPFLDKNILPEGTVEGNALLTALLEAGDRTVIDTDVDGRVRFNAGFTNADDLTAALDKLAGSTKWSDLVASHRTATEDAYEAVFEHHAYTGRSGSMYGYEGIGSIYWHMVAKLLVAVQESVIEAAAAGADTETVQGLVDAYWRIRSGLGFNKTAPDFGAIPTDPYSHTPAHAGAQQPGMTGLVKEELLTRPLELGVRVEQGEIVFDPVLLRRRELLPQTESWSVLDLGLRPIEITVDMGSLGLTVCQVPVIVSADEDDPHIDVQFRNGATLRIPGNRLDSSLSAEVFARSDSISALHAHIRNA